ncbi:unnamed protein product [Ectocarpus sp. CCAP 1310/34]|nr:unnamed protein product [Ectocarpus sp. CCAP 1310/34]
MMRMYPLLFGAGAVRKCHAFSTAGFVSSHPPPPQPPPPTLSSQIGFSFTPGGLLFPYHLGVAKCLEMEGFLSNDTPLAGSSAGALAAVVVGCGLSIDTAAELSGRVFDDCSDGGAAFRLRNIVQKSLDGALPEDAHEILNNREGAVTVGITQLGFPSLKKSVFVSNFESRADLIEVLLGSCHVPFWFSGQPYMQVRGQPTVDGFFAMPRAQFGAPDIPTADEVVRITVFPTTSVPMQSDKPGDLISPDLLDRYQSGRFMELLNYALNPGNDFVQEELFNAGFESGGVWCDRYGEDYRRRHEEKHSPEMLAPSTAGL